MKQRFKRKTIDFTSTEKTVIRYPVNLLRCILYKAKVNCPHPIKWIEVYTLTAKS